MYGSTWKMEKRWIFNLEDGKKILAIIFTSSNLILA